MKYRFHNLDAIHYQLCRQLMTIKEAAKKYNLEERELKKAISEGKIDAIKTSIGKFVSPSKLEKHLSKTGEYK